jgi:hypothetical protein
MSSLMPDVFQSGLAGPQALGLAGAAQRGLLDPIAQYEADQFNFYENQPYMMNAQYQEMLNSARPQGVPAQTNPVGVANPTGAALTSGMMAALANWPQRTPAPSTAAPAPANPGGGGYVSPTFNANLVG